MLFSCLQEERNLWIQMEVNLQFGLEEDAIEGICKD
jgi:hypothetical protein